MNVLPPSGAGAFKTIGHDVEVRRNFLRASEPDSCIDTLHISTSEEGILSTAIGL